MKLKRRFLAGAVSLVALGALTLAGCSSPGTGGDAGSGANLDGLGLSSDVQAQLTALYDSAIASGQTEVMIYAGHHDEFTAIYQAFEERFPGLTVTTGTYYGAELQSLLDAEKTTGKHVASVISNPNGDRYAEQGFVDPYEVLTWSMNPALEGRIDPSQLSDEKHMYYSPWALMFNMSYNTDALQSSELPHTWADLGSADWKDKLTFMNPARPAAP